MRSQFDCILVLMPTIDINNGKKTWRDSEKRQKHEKNDTNLWLSPKWNKKIHSKCRIYFLRPWIVNKFISMWNFLVRLFSFVSWAHRTSTNSAHAKKKSANRQKMIFFSPFLFILCVKLLCETSSNDHISLVLGHLSIFSRCLEIKSERKNAEIWNKNCKK